MDRQTYLSVIYPTFNIGTHKGRFSFKAFSTRKSMPSFLFLAVHSEPHQEPLTQKMLATPKPTFSAGIKTNTGAGPAGQNLLSNMQIAFQTFKITYLNKTPEC